MSTKDPLGLFDDVSSNDPLGLFSSEKKRTTTVLEDIGIGLKDSATPIVKAAGILGGGALGLVGADKAQESVYKLMEDTTKGMEDYWTPKDAEQNFGSKVLGTVATLPAQMLAMPFSPADTGQSMLAAGESLESAQSATLLDTLGNMAGVVLPASMSGKLATRVATGAAGNMAQDAAIRSTIGSVAETPEMKQRFENTPETLAMSGILGAGFGALGSTSPTNTKPQPQVDAQDPLGLNRDAQLQVGIDALNGKEKSILMQLAGTKDPARIDELKLELQTTRQDRNVLETGLQGKKPAEEALQTIPETVVEAPPVHEQPLVDTQVPERGVDPQLDALVDAIPQTLGEEVHHTPSTPEEANAVFNNKLERYRKLPDDRLDSQIAYKEQKLSESGVSDVTKSYIKEELATLQRIKQDRVTSKLNESLDAQAVRDNVPTEALVGGMKQGIDSAGVRGGLEYLANQKNNVLMNKWGRYLSNLAQHLLDNPKIGLDKVFWDEHQAHAGLYSNMDGTISMRKMDSTPGTFLHEVIHSAVNRVLDLHSQGLLQHPTSKAAAQEIQRLYDQAKTKYKDSFESALGREHADAVLSNQREFMAYGLTDNKVQQVFKGMQHSGTSFFTKFKDKVARLLGLDPKAKTGLDTLLENGGKLIELSDGRAPERALGLDPISHSQEQLLTKVRNGAQDIFNHAFTYQIRQMYKKDAHIQQAVKFCDDANRRKESLDIELLSGKYSKTDYDAQGKLTYTLSAAEKSDALVPSMHKLRPTEVVDVYDVMMDGYRKGTPIEKTIATNKAGWSEYQLNFANALAKISKRLYEESVRMQANVGLKNKIQERSGWVLGGRTGDHYVHVSYRGVPLRSEAYLTKAEAEHWANKYRNQVSDFEVLTEKRGATSGDNVVEYLADTLLGKNRDPKEPLADFLNRQLTNMTEQNAAIGGHTKRSNILSGFAGDQAGLSKERRGELLRDALPRAVKQYTQNIASRDIQKKMIDVYANEQNTTRTIPQRSKEIADFFVRTQIDRVAPESSLVRSGLHDLSTNIRERISTMTDSVLGYTGRDIHSLDRFTGLFSNAFYTANITMKPTIWLAQPLQAFMSGRSAFKSGASTMDVLSAVGESVKMMSMGKMGADKDFIDALYHVSQDGNTLHPQMTNEFNDWRVGGHDPNNLLNKIVSHGTGKTISAAGDKFSRFASFMFFYNLHKRSGLTKEALWNKAAADTTENMIAYGNKNLPAIYRETGLVGEQAAPLRTFAHGQAGNLIVDIKDFVSKPNARNAAPLIMTGAVIMALGGAISMPLLAEYELLRLAGMKAGWWGSEWPSVTKLMLNEAPSWVSHGLLSAATGIDLDASMRYTSVLGQLNDIQNQGLAVFFPHLAWGKQFAGGATTIISDKLGVKHTKPEMDQAIKDAIPKGPAQGIIKTIKDSSNRFTRMGAKGGAGVEQGTAEKVAPWFGTRSLAEAKVSQKILDDKRENDMRTKAVEHAAQLWTVGHKEKALGIMLKYEKEPKAATNAIINQIKLENTPAILRGKFNKSGGMSYEQMYKWKQSGMTQFRENQ